MQTQEMASAPISAM